MAVASTGGVFKQLNLLMTAANMHSTVTQAIVWDAVVIGAGPAGAVVARQLARQCKRVLLVEKQSFPRDKVCGGCIGGATLDLLDSIGLGDLPVECGGILLETFVLACSNNIARIPIGRRIAISRSTLDAALVEEAQAAGVVVQDRVIARLGTPTGGKSRLVTLSFGRQEATVHARVVIVATGLTSNLPGFSTKVLRSSYVGVGTVTDRPPCELTPKGLHMAVGADGYVGITPIERDRFDIAAAVKPDSLATNSVGGVIHTLMQQGGFPPTTDLRALTWRGTPTLTRRTLPVATHRCLLVGDAAGYVEPFTGEGIGWAIYSALLACSLLEGDLDNWPAGLEGRWLHLYKRSLVTRQRTCRVMSKMIRHASLRRATIWSLQRAPSLGRLVVGSLDHA